MERRWEMQRAWKRNEEGASEGEEEEETRECSHKKLKEEEETEANTNLKTYTYNIWQGESYLFSVFLQITPGHLAQIQVSISP